MVDDQFGGVAGNGGHGGPEALGACAVGPLVLGGEALELGSPLAYTFKTSSRAAGAQEGDMSDRSKGLIDLERISNDELVQLRSDILLQISERLKASPGSDLMYDRHGSGHSNSTSIFGSAANLINKNPTRG